MSERAFGAVKDVSHAIVAVGSRNKEKADRFIAEWCPNGADGQVQGLVDFKPKGYGSYKEVVDDPVSIPRRINGI
jgi:dihydrodiol dehydrogenase / D-xylose 1-dehydrogenase (NADP)